MTERQVSVDALRSMMTKAREKLSAARRELSAGYPGEAASCSYYAVFHALSAVLATEGKSFSSHAQTLGAFNREFVKTGLFPADTTRKLQRLFEDRQMADYDWATSVDALTADDDVSDTEVIIKACEAYLAKTTAGYAKL